MHCMMIGNIFNRIFKSNGSIVNGYSNTCRVLSKNMSCSCYLLSPRHIPKYRNLEFSSNIAQNKTPSPAFASKYQILDESNAQVILDITEQEQDSAEAVHIGDEFEGLNLKRGQTGVYDIEELVSVLKRENAKDLFVATVPAENNYVDYICIVSGRSRRHILALAEFVRKVYKRKCHKTDIIPKIEGKSSDQWMALDLGNIALHIFSDKLRSTYDLESLWSVGPEYDTEANKQNDQILELFENYSTYLKDLKPAS